MAVIPVTVPVVPVPVAVNPPGAEVTVQVPDAGRPLKATLPVATAQVGGVIVPITGAGGGEGNALMVIVEVGAEVQVAVETV